MQTFFLKVTPLGLFVLLALNLCAQQEQRNEQRRQGPPPPEKFIERFDTNADKKLTVDELKANERTLRMADNFDKIDTNKDGYIDVDELRVHQEKRKKGGKGKSKSGEENANTEN